MSFARRRRTDQKLDISTVRIILIALCMGLLVFGGVAFSIANSRAEPTDESLQNPLLLVLAALAATTPIAFFAVRTAIMRSLMSTAAPEGSSSESTDERAKQMFFTLRVIAGALAEGVGLFAAIICLSTGSTLTLAAIPPAVVIILLQIPTESQLRRFLAECARKHIR